MLTRRPKERISSCPEGSLPECMSFKEELRLMQGGELSLEDQANSNYQCTGDEDPTTTTEPFGLMFVSKHDNNQEIHGMFDHVAERLGIDFSGSEAPSEGSEV